MERNLWPDELKLLIVDDDQDVLNLIRLSLEPAGFRIIRTTKAEEGLELALREKPDLLLVDIMMPNLDGFELLRRIRRHPSMEKIPAIVISAWARNPDQQRMMQLCQEQGSNIDAYIGKPFDPADLLQTVKDVLIRYKEQILANKPVRKVRRRSATF